MTDDTKKLEALFKLGVLNSIFNSEQAEALAPDMEKFKAQAEAKRDKARKSAHEFMLRDAERQARNARVFYDAYVDAGFSGEQAFELTKVTFISD